MSTLEWIANELHRPTRKIFPSRSVITRFKDDLWQADLIDMQSHSNQNIGFEYILVVIDTYTKYVWVESLKMIHTYFDFEWNLFNIILYIVRATFFSFNSIIAHISGACLIVNITLRWYFLKLDNTTQNSNYNNYNLISIFFFCS